MKFTKMQGAGNDYIYINGFEENIDNPAELSAKISPRHFAVGADGLIIIGPSEIADFKMSMYNLDGSEGKMCGNGIRCVAKYVYDNGLTDKHIITVETLAGVKRLELDIKDGLVDTVRVDMGAPILRPSLIPVNSDKDILIDEPIEVNGYVYRMTCVSMGNPHAVVFVDDTASLKIEDIGPKFENHGMFPDRINTEFVQVINEKEINMRVWERGSGETYACGTGTCASVVACVLNKKTENNVLVHLLGGDLFIEYDKDKDTVFMTGPAVTVYTGEIII